jgi:uncharacterized protein
MNAPRGKEIWVHRTTGARYGVCGMIGGLFSGLLGIGGGTVMVPLLALWLGEQQRRAHALSLAAIVPISLASLVVYGSAGQVDPVAAAALTVGGIFGARTGAHILARAPERPLKAAFACVMFVAAVSAVVKG